jgi:predicted negative regulator of RcsB-dependent stress response
VPRLLFYDEGTRTLRGDATKIDRTLADMKERFASTMLRSAGGSSWPRYHDKGNLDAASSALTTVAESSDPGYQAVARLRIAVLLIEKRPTTE